MTEQKYDFTSATFWFFKAVGRNPGGAFSIALWQIILYGLIVGAFVVLGFPALQSIIEMAASTDDPDLSEIFAAAGTLLAIAPLLVIGSILIALMAQGAWMRLLTRNEVKGGIPFRLGGDEGRLFLVNLCFIGLLIVGYIAVFAIVAALVAVSAGVGMATDGAVWSGLINGLLWFLVVVALGVAVIILMVRFAAAPALSVRQRGFRLFESFAATRRIVGWMVLSYFVLLLIALIGSIVVSTIQQVAVMGGAMGAIAPLWSDIMAGVDPEPEQVLAVLRDAMSSPAVLIALAVIVLVQVIFQIVIEGLWHGVGAYAAVRHDGGLGETEQEISAPAESVGNAPADG